MDKKTRKGSVLIYPLRACCPHFLNTHECPADAVPRAHKGLPVNN